nr:MAG TPA: hypothetical protein [Caudoviricetes sp.]
MVSKERLGNVWIGSRGSACLGMPVIGSLRLVRLGGLCWVSARLGC